MWNFHLEDCDRILCIDNEENKVSKIIDFLNTHNFTLRRVGIRTKNKLKTLLSG
jgi:hypothetical protein